jgi:hypothetical protein
VFSRLEEFRFARLVKSVNRVAQILLSLTLVAGLNYAAARHYLRDDITTDRRYSLSAETRAYLEKIPRGPSQPPIDLVLVTPADQSDEKMVYFFKQIEGLLREYVYAAQSLPGGAVPLKTEDVDLLKQSSKAQELNKLGFKPDTMLMVIRGDRARALTLTDLYEVAKGAEPGETVATGFKGENAITSAIFDLIEAKPDKIYFTQGHGEMSTSDTSPLAGLSSLTDALRARNYRVDNLDLLGNTPIPDDAKLIIIAGPIKEFLPYEVKKLRDYLDNNGRVLVMLRTEVSSGLDDLFSQWGLKADNMRVFDINANATTDGGDLLISDFPSGGKDLTGFLVNTGLPVRFGDSRPVRVDPDAPPNDRRQAQEILRTSKGEYSWAERDYLNGLHKMDPAVDLQGPVSVGAISEQHALDGLGLPGGRLLVFGNADFVANERYSYYGNSFLFTNSVYYLTDHQDLLNIPAKPVLQLHLNIAKAQFLGLAWRLALLPALFVVLGALVYYFRNR